MLPQIYTLVLKVSSYDLLYGVFGISCSRVDSILADLPVILMQWTFYTSITYLLLIGALVCLIYRINKEGRNLDTEKRVGWTFVVVLSALLLVILSQVLFGSLVHEESSNIILYTHSQIAAGIGVLVTGLGIFVPIMFSIWSQLIGSKHSLIREASEEISRSDSAVKEERWEDVLESAYKDLSIYKDVSSTVTPIFYIISFLASAVLLFLSYLLSLGEIQLSRITYHRISSITIGLGACLMAVLMITFLVAIMVMRPYKTRLGEMSDLLDVIYEERTSVGDEVDD